MRRKTAKVSLLIGLVIAILSIPIPHSPANPTHQTIRIEASAFKFSPAEIHLNAGDELTIELVSTDVVHGLSIDGYAFELKAEPGQPARGTLVANRSGVFRFRCSVPCGNLHPFMIGKIHVGPNDLLLRGVLLSLLGIFSALYLPASTKQPSS